MMRFKALFVATFLARILATPDTAGESTCEVPPEPSQQHSLLQRDASRGGPRQAFESHDQGTAPDGFDCDAGYSNWREGWSDDKKKWCCEKYKKGCQDAFDCDVGFSNMINGWSSDKKEWCCENYQKGCEDAFDCEAGTENSEEGWSSDKKEWCCERYQKGCPDTFDCEVGYSDWEKGWSSDKKDWCCKKYKKGCQDAFDCDAGYSKWEEGWSSDKKEWCCEKYLKGCADTFDCDAGYSNWEKGWSKEKKEWCCDKYHMGCNDVFDCDAGDANWQAGWSKEKKTWCCDNYLKGCEATESARLQNSTPPALRLELRLAHRLRDLHKGPFGPAPQLLEDLRSTLCEAADLACSRLIMLDIRGEYMELNLVGTNAELLQKFLDKLEDSKNGSAAGVDDGGSKQAGAWVEVERMDADPTSTTIDLEVIEGEPSAMHTFWVWKDQLGNATSKLRQGPLGSLLVYAELKQSDLTPAEKAESAEAFKKWQAEKKTAPVKSGSITSMPPLCGPRLAVGMGVFLLAW